MDQAWSLTIFWSLWFYTINSHCWFRVPIPRLRPRPYDFRDRVRDRDWLGSLARFRVRDWDESWAERLVISIPSPPFILWKAVNLGTKNYVNIHHLKSSSPIPSPRLRISKCRVRFRDRVESLTERLALSSPRRETREFLQGMPKWFRFLFWL